MQAIFLTKEKGIELLKEGNSLTAHKSNMDTLRMEEGQITWMGRHDQGPTFLEEAAAKSLFRGRKWYVNLH